MDKYNTMQCYAGIATDDVADLLMDARQNTIKFANKHFEHKFSQRITTENCWNW